MKKTLLVAVVLAVLAACGNRPDQGGFYSYIDAQGNSVTVMRQSPVRELPPSELEGDQLDAAALDAVGENYRSDEEVTRQLDERERDRFVSYLDADGYLVTQAIDVPAARAARQATPGFDSLEGRYQSFVERVEPVPADCCLKILSDSVSLKAGRELIFTFQERGLSWIYMPSKHPAVAIELAPGLSEVRIQTFIGKQGYLHPQAVFLNASGEPLLLVDNLFARRYPETWSRMGYLEGELPVEKGSRWLVVYLGYAGEAPNGRSVLLPGDYYWQDGQAPLALQGELVLRGL
ncbi:MAG: hypothetical protein CVV10_05040 [Gammaproteobacteria bacterium HGW-Gammaproteobacteria-14]|nr:MAG: hypothetical protein CVV10_05040 [Gammaproteobacteria bacterium HGW-Gammaproteobacteria-14]